MVDYTKVIHPANTANVEPSSLVASFDIHPGEVISLVGAGGKTTLMFVLARELVATGIPVITTTTTKILEPNPAQTPLLLLDTDEEQLIKLLCEKMQDYPHITIAGEKLNTGKLNGIRTELVLRLAALRPEACIIVEADGAAGRSLKAPNSTEPVIPDNTSLVIPVVGIDILGRSLNAENVFRPKIASRLLGLPIGEAVSLEHIAKLLMHPNGISKGSPAQVRIIPFINKVGQADYFDAARDLAMIVLADQRTWIGHVVFGQAQSPETVWVVC